MILKELERKGLVELLPMQQDKRIRFTSAGSEYADAMISRLRKTGLFVIEEMGTARILLIRTFI